MYKPFNTGRGQRAARRPGSRFQFGRLLAAGLLVSGLSASCVSQQEYDNAVRLAKDYELKNTELEAKYEAMRNRLREAENAVNVRNASGSVSGADLDQYDQRISELRGQLESLGGAPGDIERFNVAGGYVYMIQDKVLFDSGSAEIGAEGRSALVNLARNISAAPHGQIFVRGHTDSDPVKKPATLQKFPKGNLQLSAERAVSVADVLTGDGKVPGRDVVVMGFGQWNTVADNGTADGKKLNRRVEIFVSDPSPTQ